MNFILCIRGVILLLYNRHTIKKKSFHSLTQCLPFRIFLNSKQSKLFLHALFFRLLFLNNALSLFPIHNMRIILWWQYRSLSYPTIPQNNYLVFILFSIVHVKDLLYFNQLFFVLNRNENNFGQINYICILYEWSHNYYKNVYLLNLLAI